MPQRRVRLLITGLSRGRAAVPHRWGPCSHSRGRYRDGTSLDAFNTAVPALMLSTEQIERAARFDVNNGSRSRHLRADEPSRTITVTNATSDPSDLLRIQLHDGSLRKLRVSEIAALQSFPESFDFSMTRDVRASSMLGNAFPPAAAAMIAAAQREYVAQLREHVTTLRKFTVPRSQRCCIVEAPKCRTRHGT